MKSRPAFRIILVIAVMAMLSLIMLVQGQAVAMSASRVAFINVGEGDSALLSDGSGFDVLKDL